MSHLASISRGKAPRRPGAAQLTPFGFFTLLSALAEFVLDVLEVFGKGPADEHEEDDHGH